MDANTMIRPTLTEYLHESEVLPDQRRRVDAGGGSAAGGDQSTAGRAALAGHREGVGDGSLRGLEVSLDRASSDSDVHGLSVPHGALVGPSGGKMRN